MRRIGAGLAALLVAAACRQVTVTQTPSPAQSETAGKPSASPGPAMGRLVDVVDRRVTVGGREGTSGLGIASGEDVATDENGVATFSVQRAFDECQIWPGSRARLQLPPDPPLKALAGELTCRSGSQDVTLGSGRTTMKVESETVFGVRAGPDGSADLWVNKGFVQLDAGGEAARLVGAGAEVSIPAEAAAGPLRPFDPSELARADQREALARMAAAIRPDFSLPAQGTSLALGRIAATRTLVVGVDGRDLSAQSQSFVSSFLTFVAGQWGARLDSRPFSGTALPPIAAAVVSDSKITGAEQLPFFDDAAGRSWFIEIPAGDAALKGAWGDFVAKSLRNGDYSVRYSASFTNRVPVYELVHPIVLRTRFTS